ncbi:MAG: hypothetical protein EB078_04860 [Proteobacteria bacterium]|nr:hypothetical protein [Pseudomonadota bacterium]NDC24541.1 hypothetical protein [Pseudomonadota bacterium]NDD04214.1 hypothetical protein [Pseudomonadota bacterium]NDG26924.1 hypothetical protein [Pseudomonadota bacterium]
MKLSSIEKICREPQPLSWDETKCKVMQHACQQMAEFQIQASLEFRTICKNRRFSPDQLKTEADFEKLPWIGVEAMKKYLLLSKPIESSVLSLTSSGTRGRKTEIHFDSESLERAQEMLTGVWGQEGLISKEKTSYLNFIYDPKNAKDLGIAFTVRNGQRFAPSRESYFALKMKNDSWVFDVEETLMKLREFEASGGPVRLMGIPSFLFDLMEVMQKNNQQVKLAPESLVMTGGGWKAAEDKKVSRQKFREMIHQLFGITDVRIRDGYGLAEHGSPYLECQNHSFHIPAFNRIIVRDPFSLKPMGTGKVGLLQFITPFNSMMPNLSILSTDLGYLDEKPCACGTASPTFTLVGRGGLTKNKGCAMTASEIVKRSDNL